MARRPIMPRIRNRTKKAYIDYVQVAQWSLQDRLKPPAINRLITFGGGLGDHLLCTALFRALRERHETNLWMMSDFPALFAHNPDVDRVVPSHEYYIKLGQRYNVYYKTTYTTHITAEHRDMPPSHHLIANMASFLNIEGDIALRPFVYLTEAERQAGRLAARQIAVQSSIASARYPIITKEWYPKRVQAVVDALYPDYTIVQVGLADDPPLLNALDLRGKLSLRQTAAILATSQLFIGQVGFLMHLARAVDCRAVIVFGGREHPRQSGYVANTNLYTDIACAPCWLWDGCPIQRECMRQISSDMVIDAAMSQLARHEEPLELERVVIPKLHDIPELAAYYG